MISGITQTGLVGVCILGSEELRLTGAMVEWCLSSGNQPQYCDTAPESKKPSKFFISGLEMLKGMHEYLVTMESGMP